MDSFSSDKSKSNGAAHFRECDLVIKKTTSKVTSGNGKGKQTNALSRGNSQKSKSLSLNDISNYKQNRPSFVFDLSRESVSSDDDSLHKEDPLPAGLRLPMSSDEEDSIHDEELLPVRLIDYILADRLDDENGLDIYNDWDSGFTNSSMESHDVETRSWTNSLLEPIHIVSETGLEHSRRAAQILECPICLEMTYLGRRRLCCTIQICNKCVSMYVTSKVKDGKVQIECPSNECKSLMHQNEIRQCLSIEMREKYSKFLIDANKDPHVKTCPSCSFPYHIDPARLKIKKKKLKHGVEVRCKECYLYWCFCCQAPFHTNMTCKKYKNGNEMVKRWAKERNFGQINAQRCPKCKIFVQKMDGCNQMNCTQCKTRFCYRCGDRYISAKFFGHHWNRFSVVGCKYNLMPEKNWLRRLIRGSFFAGRVLSAIVFAALGVAAGAVLIAGSVVILPGYGIFRLRCRMWAAKQRKKSQALRMISVAEKQRALREKQMGNLETVLEESETETSEPSPDPQQVQVIVHHPAVQEEVEVMAEDSKECDIIVNKYVDEDSEVIASRLVSKENSVSAAANETITSRDLKEVSVKAKYEEIDLNVVASAMEDDEKSDEKVSKNDDNGSIDDKFLKSENGNVSEVKLDVASLCTERKEIVTVWKRAIPEVEDLSDEGKEETGTNHDMKKEVIENAGPNSHSSDHSSNDILNNQSLSKEKNELIEKTMKTKEFKDAEKDSVLEKVDRETVGKGCFGNIFNVAKRSTGVTATYNMSNEERFFKLEKPNRQKVSLLAVRKAATWEKCRRNKIEMDWVKSSIDSVNDLNNGSSLVVHKSPSSFSSILGFNFADDELDRKKEGDPYRYNCPQQEEVIGDTNGGDGDCIAKTLGKVEGGPVDTNQDFKDEGITRVRLEISASEGRQTLQNDHEYISPINLVTHL